MRYISSIEFPEGRLSLRGSMENASKAPCVSTKGLSRGGGLALFFLLLVPIASSITGCAPALPAKSLSKEVGDRALAAGDSAKFAHEAADRAEAQLAESRRLHAEAVQMLEQAKKIEAYCVEVKSKIPKQRVVYIEKKVKEKPKSEEGSEEEEEDEGPKYSPSDAPVNAPVNTSLNTPRDSPLVAGNLVAGNLAVGKSTPK